MIRTQILIFSLLSLIDHTAHACPAELVDSNARAQLYDQAMAELKKPTDIGDMSIVRENLECLSNFGDPAAAELLSVLLLGSDLGEPDLELSRNYLKIAIDKGDAKLKYEIGQALLYGQISGLPMPTDFDLAVRTFISTSELGHAESSAQLCAIYRYGMYGVMKNIGVAIDYCVTAAEQGDRLSEIYAADMLFEFGEYPDDARRAVMLYFSSAISGTNSGPIGLGRAYESGTGVLKDYLLAYAWYNIGSSRLSPSDQTTVSDAMAKLETILSPSQIIDAQSLAKSILANMASFSPH